MAATRIIVEVDGGVVQSVYCSDPKAHMSVMDWDNAKGDDQYRIECELLDLEAQRLLTEVY